MKRCCLLHNGRLLTLLISTALLAGTAQAQFTLLHEFAGGGSDGSGPRGSLTLDGSTLFGMTYSGGADAGGVVFTMNADGTGYTNLHEFAGGAGDGGYPRGLLTLSGGTLYGMTYGGGASDLGVVFKMNTDGSGYTNLHEFAGGSADGGWPYGSLTLSGNTLYGTTYLGGGSGWGTVFKLNTDGTGFGLVHEFVGTDGGYLLGSLALSGPTLYGMAYLGGNWNEGTVFKVNTNGTGFTTLRDFSGAGGGPDGGYPWGSLAVSGDTLYAMTRLGGTNDVGAVFKMNTNGGDFALLHEFGGSDGSYPYGDLTLAGSTLYGMTYAGGTNDLGVVFQVSTNGTGYSLLHEFAGGSSDGARPYGSLTLSGPAIYGMTSEGGDSDLGTVFSYSLAVVPEPSTAALLGAGLAGLWMRRRRAGGQDREMKARNRAGDSLAPVPPFL